MRDPVTEPLSQQHDRTAFSCGVPSLDKFLRELAGQYDRRGLARTSVLVEPGTRRVLGYHTLSAASVPFNAIPTALAKGLPRHQVPLVLLGRLAVDASVRGRGWGEALLVDSFGRFLQGVTYFAAAGIVVSAIDDAAAGFYRRYGFVDLLDADRQLLLPVSTIRTSATASRK